MKGLKTILILIIDSRFYVRYNAQIAYIFYAI